MTKHRHERASTEGGTDCLIGLAPNPSSMHNKHGHEDKSMLLESAICTCEFACVSRNLRTKCHLPGWKDGADGGCRNLVCCSSYATACVACAVGNSQAGGNRQITVPAVE